ncbi:MAG: hypothetical protein HRU20_27465 [Pseudomonadales bacterium]|nr:hypothetical protein [Pseudomonadales bacterium]
MSTVEASSSDQGMTDKQGSDDRISLLEMPMADDINPLKQLVEQLTS